MFAWIGRWFQLRKRRQQSIDAIKNLGFHFGPGGFCYLCQENTNGIYTLETKQSFAGEKFAFLSRNALGYLCARCACVSDSPYISGGNGIRVDEWKPKDKK